MEKLLLIQITPEDAILNLAQRMHIRTVSVSPNDYKKSIGQLAGFPDQTATHTSDGTGLDGSMLIFCDVKERHQNQILEKLRTMDVSITYKAILTPTNRHWTVIQLYDELHREHRAMTGKEQDDSK